ncbi:hypothetical protein CYMTET_32976 [Cymbomonas tetramitiformis]|uniref:Uncharacterized protein n=1 Tax=Cymbomonas tetramitiformis TaxID=36881 RepID=A0AAE0KRE2_9CHLO|nr:hypothetical protein CYMTET_32976 [Cymbomonas tetramitiformis]
MGFPTTYDTCIEEAAAIGLEGSADEVGGFSPVGDASCSAGLLAIPPILSKLGHAQAQGLLFWFCAHPRLGFWLRGVPPTMMREAAKEHARRMQGALRDLLPGGGLVRHCLKFATLPHRMGLTRAARVSSAAWLGGFAQVWEDMRELFPAVTVGAR